jgi:hypothetical protein
MINWERVYSSWLYKPRYGYYLFFFHFIIFIISHSESVVSYMTGFILPFISLNCVGRWIRSGLTIYSHSSMKHKYRVRFGRSLRANFNDRSSLYRSISLNLLRVDRSYSGICIKYLSYFSNHGKRKLRSAGSSVFIASLFPKSQLPGDLREKIKRGAVSRNVPSREINLLEMNSDTAAGNWSDSETGSPCSHREARDREKSLFRSRVLFAYPRVPSTCH